VRANEILLLLYIRPLLCLGAQHFTQQKVIL